VFSTAGFSIWDNGWYGGHYLLGYSLIFPPLRSLLGVGWTGIVAVSLSTLVFRRLPTLPTVGFRAGPATMLFALQTGASAVWSAAFASTVQVASPPTGVAGVRGNYDGGNETGGFGSPM